MDLAVLTALLSKHEGRKLKLYQDSVGKWSIGCGRNLEDIGITDAECDLMLQDDIERTIKELNVAIPWWISLDDTRRMILVDMGFMGVSKLMGFRKMLQALYGEDYRTAAAEMLDSLWAKQVGKRADELAAAMISGSF